MINGIVEDPSRELEIILIVKAKPARLYIIFASTFLHALFGDP
jgi:hypothetical protein